MDLIWELKLVCFSINFSEYVERRCDGDGYWMVKPGSTKTQYPYGLSSQCFMVFFFLLETRFIPK